MAKVHDDSTVTGRASDGQQVYIAVPSSSDSGVDLVELWVALWKGKWLIIGLSGLFAVIAIVYSLLATPVFRSEVVLAPVTRSQTGALGNLGGLASLAGINLNIDQDNSHALAILKSKSFVADFIQENRLLPVLFQDEWDASNQRWITDDPDLQRDVRDGVERFIEDVRTISEDPQTGLVTLAVEWTDPATAAKWAAEMVKRINEMTRQRDIEESQRKLDYLNQELAKSSLVELRLAISRVIEEQIGAMMLAQAQLEYAFEIIDPAVVPKERISPKRTLIVVVATLMGGFLAVLILLGTVAARKMRERL